jgi:hypothetical protein
MHVLAYVGHEGCAEMGWQGIGVALELSSVMATSHPIAAVCRCHIVACCQPTHSVASVPLHAGPSYADERSRM